MRLNTVVIDNGTGFTKMGYAGNQEPNFIIPTCVADKPNKNKVQVSRKTYDQLDFYVGEEAQKRALTYDLVYPLRSGEISNFDLMEKLWHRCIFDYLRCEPEEHVVMLTEPPMNPPVNRETMAEIMFETFNVAGLHIGVQATLALYSSWYHSKAGSVQKEMGLTGTVIDSGDGVTHIIPMADGYVIGSCIKHIPLAGSDITNFFAKMIRDRGYKIDAQDMKGLAKAVKDQFSYVSEDPAKEMLLWDKRVKKKNKLMYKKFKYKSILSEKEYEIDIGYESFLGPEMFFRPEIVDPNWERPLDQELDETILLCPVDLRRDLYKNVILSGGSCQTEGLKDRLERELTKRVIKRLDGFEKKSGKKPKPIEINIHESPYENFAVWNGGSMLASSNQFGSSYHTRQEYMEKGPSIARYNPVFTEGI